MAQVLLWAGAIASKTLTEAAGERHGVQTVSKAEIYQGAGTKARPYDPARLRGTGWRTVGRAKRVTNNLPIALSVLGIGVNYFLHLNTLLKCWQ